MSYINKEELIKRMQVDAPMNWTDTDFELGEEWQYKSDMEVVEGCAEVKVIPIPPRATNGDMIKTIFPKYTFIDSILPFDGVDMNIIECAERDLFFDIDWWYAPYRKE